MYITVTTMHTLVFGLWNGECDDRWHTSSTTRNKIWYTLYKYCLTWFGWTKSCYTSDDN